MPSHTVINGTRTPGYDLRLVVPLPGGVRDHLARAKMLRDEAERKQAEAEAEPRAAVRELPAKGVTQREAGELLGLSFQRVNQPAKA